MNFTLRTTDDALNAIIYSCVLNTLGFKFEDDKVIFNDAGSIPEGDIKLNVISPERSALVVCSRGSVISLSFMNHEEVQHENSNK